MLYGNDTYASTVYGSYTEKIFKILSSLLSFSGKLGEAWKKTSGSTAETWIQKE